MAARRLRSKPYSFYGPYTPNDNEMSSMRSSATAGGQYRGVERDGEDMSNDAQTDGKIAMPNQGYLSYRDKPMHDENTTVPCTPLIELQSPSNCQDTVSYYHNTFSTSVQPYTVDESTTMANLLMTSDRMHIADADPNNSMMGGIAPSMMSRAESADSYNMDINKHAYQGEVTPSQKSDFKFQKFGMQLTGSLPPSYDNRGLEYKTLPSDLHTHTQKGNLQQQMLFSAHPNIFDSMFSVYHGVKQHNQGPKKSESKPSSFTVAGLNEMNKPAYSHMPHPITTRAQSLGDSFPDRHNGIILKIVKQPGAQHRARYMTEGSRGAVKDSLNQGHPVVQLLGWDKAAYLEVFIGTDSGKVKPHSFYQACKIISKNSVFGRERNLEGTTVIDVELDPSKNMMAVIDCVGILKLRNTDVEKRVGLLKSKKKSTRCRMIFRVNLMQDDGSLITLQVPSVTITCTQPNGQPEVHKISLNSSNTSGGQSLFVIGKNFTKGFTVKFQEYERNSNRVVWEAEADVDQDFIHSAHFICTVPCYHTDDIYDTVHVKITVATSGGASDPVPFEYFSEKARKMM